MKQQKSSKGQTASASTATLDGNVVCEFLKERPKRLKTIASGLKIPPKNLKNLGRILAELETAGRVRRFPGERWGVPAADASFSGRITILPSGAGRAPLPEPINGRREIHIPAPHCNGAWGGDIVLVERLPPKDSGLGRVVRILERTEADQLGVCIGKYHKAMVFRPASGACDHFFLAQAPNIHKGNLALLKPKRKLRDRYEDREIWQAELLRDFGPALTTAAQEAIVKLGRGVPMRFPELALEQARSFPASPDSVDIAGREDLRSAPFVTIDGASARDFDDAIHVEETQDGFLLRVAIADVSHYVTPDTTPGSLDDEARRRGNSWYFPTSVEPMLPQALSNGLCSLKPGEDRLAMLAELPFTREGLPLKPRFAAIVMRSAARLIYDDVAAFFLGEDQGIPRELAPMLGTARKLYELLARRRRERGTMDFIIPEPSYKFNDSGELLAMEDAKRNDAHMLIEEFMIAANEAVAAYLGGEAAPFLYRVHPAPEPEKLANLFNTLRLTAPEILPPELQRDGADAKAILTVLARAQGEPQQYLVNRLCLRAMGQARYQAENIGHFGLASSAYCHFTSPIRRYADLLVHRTLKAAIGMSADNLPDRQELDAIANGLNEQERKAVECERDMARRMACLILMDHVGETREGIISGVTEFGLFVEFRDMPADGLIRMSDLGHEWLELDQGRQRLVGRTSGKVWRLGQNITVRIMAVDTTKLEITLSPVTSDGGNARRKMASGRGSGATRSAPVNKGRKPVIRKKNRR